MPWSTREIGELAGASLRTVRHYHDIGLLEAPERDANGYKQYGTSHLVRLLRIRRLTELGFSLSQIADIGASGDDAAPLLRGVDAELADTIARLQQVRLDVAELLSTPDTDPSTPARLVSVASGATTDADRAFLVVVAKVVSATVLDAYVEMLRERSDEPVLRDFESLSDDADDATLDDLAIRLLDHTREVHATYPALRDLTHGSPVGHERCAEAISAALTELYSPAQNEVMRRCALLREAGTLTSPGL